MYFAGRLEHGNVDEYVQAARHATALGFDEFAAALRRMADVEREHELFFMNTVTGHRLLPLAKALFKWGPPARPARLSPAAKGTAAGHQPETGVEG
jgi:hypothetical protein